MGFFTMSANLMTFHLYGAHLIGPLFLMFNWQTYIQGMLRSTLKPLTARRRISPLRHLFSRGRAINSRHERIYHFTLTGRQVNPNIRHHLNQNRPWTVPSVTSCH